MCRGVGSPCSPRHRPALSRRARPKILNKPSGISFRCEGKLSAFSTLLRARALVVREEINRRKLLTMVAAAGLLACAPHFASAGAAASDISAQRFEVGPGGVRIGPDRRPEEGRGEVRGRGGLCAELRAACLNRDRLGEQGEGNCRRYRRTCR